MEITSRLAKRIRSLREAKGLTQEQLAYKSGLNRTFMNHVENERRKITVESLNKILTGLEISFKDFFDDAVFENGKGRKK